MTGISDKCLPLWILACHVVETLHSYKCWSPVCPSPTVGKCDKAITNVVRRKLLLVSRLVTWLVSLRQVYRREPAEYAERVRNKPVLGTV
jgi:hypothetical protein